jgi:hypothetical protein
MTLPDVLLSDDRRESVVADCVVLVDSEVKKRGGVSGFAIKGGYKVVKRLDGGKMVPKMVNDLLPEFASAFEPFHHEFRAGSATSFSAHTDGRHAELAESLLAITDGKAVHAKNSVLKKVYAKLRPSAKKNLQDSMPAITLLVDQHAPK